MDRREFLRDAALAGAAIKAMTGAAQSAKAAGLSCDDLPHQGAKKVVRGMKAVASSQHPIVTQTMLDMMKSGGNAVDAAMAGAITQATVQLDMTNHTGTLSFLYWEAKTGKTYQLNSMGTLVPHLPPFRTYPPGLGGVAAGAPMSCIPGFMPGVAAVHARFGTKPWKSLVEPAIPWAENGHRMDEFTRSVLDFELEGNTFFPSMRAIYAPNGFTPSVGELWKNPALAKTLGRLADEGPDYFTKGEWGQHFVATANQLGWAIKLADMTANPPRWQDPMHWKYKGYEVVQPSPPGTPGSVLQHRPGYPQSPRNHQAWTLHRVGGEPLFHGSRAAASRIRVGNALRSGAIWRAHGCLDFRRLSWAPGQDPEERDAQARRRSDQARGVHVLEGQSPGIRLVLGGSQSAAEAAGG